MTTPTSRAQAQPQSDFFVFGDSLSDTGNLFEATLGFVPLSPPYFQGRFSNGPLAVEILAQQLGLPLTRKSNFAIGGARTDRTNNADRGNLKFGGLLDQIDRFTAQAKTLGAGAEDLYLVWAGGNDFLKLLNNPSASTAVVQAAVSNIVTSVRALAKAGAKNIVVVQNPNIGRVPLSLEAGQQQNVTAVVSAFNAALKTSLERLKLKGKQIILADLFPVSEAIAQNPAAFGFSNTTEPLLENASADPNQFFFWDDVHPTTRGHSIFADSFRSTIVSTIRDDLKRTGTPEADRLVGFSGDDRLIGQGAADYLEGNGGNDRLLGDIGDDRLTGGNGRDQLTGGAGRDQLTGGAGQDQFIYTSAKEGRDTITDFELGNDLIDLRQIFKGSEYDRTNRFEAYVKLVRVNQGTVVRVDANGDAAGGFQSLALLSGVNVDTVERSSFRLGES